MCGIAGRLNLDYEQPVSRELVARMCESIRHRGPDDDGFYLDGPFGMGMRRLSIIDVASGKQPISNEDGSVWTVFNGEIYNFGELRSALEAKGHTFRTRTDTEVIPHLYEEYGEDFVQHLAGMFAIALWDQPNRTLLLARDRLGIKPLYYFLDSDRLVFGSEIKVLLEDGIPREIDSQAMHDYLSLNYVPGPRSIFRGVSKLQPGHVLRCSRGKVRLRRYWDLTYPEPGGKERSEASWSEELVERLRAVVKEHLVSDVPLGVSLSGGVDSSLVVALMREVSSQTIRTFSIGFEEKSYDELVAARTVAKHFGTEHHELVVRTDAAAVVPELVRYFDEPFADSSALPVYCVSKLAREHVKVTLTGDGADEVFAGYETYAAYRVAEIYKRLPKVLSTRILPALVRQLPVSHRKVSFDYKAKRFLGGALLSPVEGHYQWKVIFSEDLKSALRRDLAEAPEDTLRLYRDAFRGCSATDPLVKLQHIDTMVYLPDDILVKADRMSMATSLEARVPFIDHRIVEFAATLPTNLKLRGLTKKYILRRLLADRLPRSVARAKKRGFNVPIPMWLRGDLRELVHDVLSPRRVRDTGLFDPATVEAIVREHEEKRSDRSRDVWGLLMFMLWHDRYMTVPTSRKSAA